MPEFSHLAPNDPRLPDALEHVEPRCRGLWIAGDAALLARRPRIGIIGSRRPRADAADAAYRIAYDAARAGIVVVSGLALGIDSIAHEAALDAGTPTIAVLAGGLARVKPTSNRALAVRIAGASHERGVLEGHRSDAPGLVVTEYGPGQEESHPYRYVERNRIIAALSDYVVVVQAAHRSGSMSTCEHALALGVQVGVLPSAPDDPCHAGTTQLIHEGADAIVDGTSLFRRLELHGVMRHGFADRARAGAVVDPLDPGGWIEPAIAHQLALDDDPLLVHLSVPRTADELADLAGLPLTDTRIQLLLLEQRGVVTHAIDGTWTRAPGPS